MEELAEVSPTSDSQAEGPEEPDSRLSAAAPGPPEAVSDPGPLQIDGLLGAPSVASAAYSCNIGDDQSGRRTRARCCCKSYSYETAYDTAMLRCRKYSEGKR